MAPALKRRKLPYQLLRAYERDGLKEFARLKAATLGILARVVMDAPHDPDENEMAGSSRQKMQKALDQRQTAPAKAVRDYERRLEYGAPLRVGLGPATIDLVLRALSPTGLGFEPDDSPGITTEETGAPTREIVPLGSVVATTGFSTLELKDALAGKWTRPRVLKHPQSSQYTLFTGAATFMAARFMFIPALEMDVYSPEEVQPLNPSYVQGTRLLWEETARALLKPIAYRLPSFLEPMAQLARRLSPQDFYGLADAETEEERDVRQRLEQRDARRVETWAALYNQALGEHGLDPKAANAWVRDQPRWRAVEDLTEAGHSDVEKVAKKWARLRQDLAAALEACAILAAEDTQDINPAGYDFVVFKAEADKGIPVSQPKPSAFLYSVGQKVEVRNGVGEWTPGEVTAVDGFDIRVRQEDGRYRLIRDTEAIRATEHSGDATSGVDTGSAIWYNNGMDKEIRIPEFNVIMAAGTTSARLEEGLLPCTEEMNKLPLRVNRATWEQNLGLAQAELERTYAICRDLAGWPQFRPNAPADCVKVFYEKRGLVPQRVGKSGVPSLDKEALQAMHSAGDDLAGFVIEAREARSRLSQLEAWKPYAEAGLVQATWNQLGTPHGRYSCDTPNLQNRITAIRETIEAPAGYKFVSLDLGQAEYVTWASLSKDPTLIAAFADGRDFHEQMWQEIKAEAGDINLHETTPRQAGKMINFALLYLMQPFVLAKRLGVNEDTARRIIAAYEKRAPIAVAYKNRMVQEIQRTGTSSTKLGRTRFLPDLRSARGHKQHELTKTLWHHHNAGTAAELLKVKQLRSWKALRAAFSVEQAALALQMHDEVIYQVAEDVLPEVTSILETSFQREIEGFLPFRLTVKTGQNWLEVSK